MKKDILLFAGSSNVPLAREVAQILGITLGKVDLTRFADGELRPWIQEDVRDKTVFVLQSFSYPMDEHIMEMSLIGDAIARSAPKTMVAIIPYMGYARQDKQHRTGEPVSARVIAKFLEVSKYQEVITIDLHNDAIVGFFQIPVTHLSALDILAKEIKKLHVTNGLVVSPDVGGVKRARNLAYLLNVPMVVMEKKRYLDRFDKSESFQIIGDVAGRDIIIIDDIISTGGTILTSVQSLKEAGAKSVNVFATHGVLAGHAVENLKDAALERIVLTDTIAISKDKFFPGLEVASVAPLIASAIERMVG
ncbi:ribose-phosphate pyrophosphokinase [Candidatus Gottesmanbacteria bacterium]|nr:ribose-phosphate pyrophosphokinase [Candidatus Gottesmanbacteria bacterium]MBI3577632.1 ribose-phosphate pyrophosphokinase [Candidatus Gottesmanbacteria bacterium]